MSDRYAVFGHPIAHSRSPWIHARFAAASGEDLRYEAILAPLDGFAACMNTFRAEGGRGANVTVPFKEEAYRLANTLSERAELAGAVNTLRFDGAQIFGDNTDGAGLLHDLRDNLGIELTGARVLLLGAGGAARGAIPALLSARPQHLVVANRTVARAEALAQKFAGLGPLRASSFAALANENFDLLINATAASLGGEVPPVPATAWGERALAYDMMYAAGDTPFIAQARKLSAERGLMLRFSDGLGMLAEQAAEAFSLWRGIRPATAKILADLRADLRAELSAAASAGRSN